MNILRILNLDGGGMRGLFSAYFMERFCEDADIDGTKLWEHFDLILGTGMGTIMGSAYAIGKSPTDLINFFTKTGPIIFRDGPLPIPVSMEVKEEILTQPEDSGGINIAKSNGSFYGSGSVGNEPNSVLADKLNEIFGETKLFQLKTNVIFSAIRRTDIPLSTEQLPFQYRPIFFSNMLGNELIGQEELVKKVVQACSSTPFYFPAMEINGKLYIDGSVGMNNLSLQGLAFSTFLGDEYDRIVMLSVGCGIGNTGFYDPILPTKVGIEETLSDNIAYLKQIGDVSGAVAQESSAQSMQQLSDLNIRINNADFIHYRFNNRFNMNSNTELDNSGVNFYANMFSASKEQYDKDTYKIAAFINNCNFN